MSDDMIDLMAGDARLRQRLGAYADLRLSPDAAATSRIRARVLAHAHRQADLARADAALTIVGPLEATLTATRRPGRIRRVAIAMVAAAALVAAMVGGAAAAGPGGALYDARLWVETLTLPGEPSERALAELDRLTARLQEADAAALRGDAAAAAAALAAYERILGEASASVVAAGDPVAAAAFETGIGRNVEVLLALIGHVPPQASDAIGQAVERAIARSSSSIDAVHGVKKPTPAAGGGGGAGAGSGGGPAVTPKPTKDPATRPEATAKPTRTPPERPEATPKPTKAPKPDAAPPGRGNPPGGPPS